MSLCDPDTPYSRTWREVAAEFTRRTGQPMTKAAARDVFDRAIRKLRVSWHLLADVPPERPKPEVELSWMLSPTERVEMGMEAPASLYAELEAERVGGVVTDRRCKPKKERASCR